jgi:hypothetical protein
MNHKGEITYCYFKKIGLYYSCFYINNREIVEGEYLVDYEL